MAVDSSFMSELLFATIVCLGAGALGASLTNRSAKAARIVGCGGALLGSIFALGFGLTGLAGGSLRLYFPDLLPIGGAALGIDRLSAFFVVMIAVAAIPAALYGIGYTRAYEGNHSLGGMGFAFNTFIAAMILVPLAQNVLTFLALWEVMSLASYFLVITEHEREGTLGAGWVYFVMTHAGFAALLLGFLLLAQATGTAFFSDWHVLAVGLDPRSRDLVFVLLAVGFGSKAGVIPLHIWLPRAHPAAPSHVSALMSGVMIKLGVYGLVRLLLRSRHDQGSGPGAGAVAGAVVDEEAADRRDVVGGEERDGTMPEHG